jgi:hypothetical protein
MGKDGELDLLKNRKPMWDLRVRMEITDVHKGSFGQWAVGRNGIDGMLAGKVFK